MLQSSTTSLDRLNRRNAWRVLPLLVAGYVLNTLDKGNIGFASLEMNKDLGLSDEAFGLGAGLFFITYTLFEIPSNLLLRRIGARPWLSRILISWGLASMAMALTAGQTSFYALRLLLGIAEAGCYPGVIFYLSLWFPKEFKARAVMLFFLGAPISAVLGAPLSGALLDLPPLLGLKGWQWLFIVEGLPSVLLGLFALRALKNGPADAGWMDEHEKQALAVALERDQAQAEAPPHIPLAKSYAARLGLFSATNFANALGFYSTFIWIPRMAKQLGGFTNFETGIVVALPYLFGALALFACAWSSDRRRERKWHSVAMLALGAIAMGLIALGPSPLADMLLLTLSVMGAIGVQGTLFAMFSEGLRDANPSPAAFAAGLATITTVGNLGGFAGPILIGALLGRGGGPSAVMLLIAAAFAIAGILVAVARPSALGPIRTSPSPVLSQG